MSGDDVPSPAQRPARIVIADGSPFVQAGLRDALEGAGMEVVAVCADAETTGATTLAVRPDGVLLSAQLPGGSLDALREVRDALPGTEWIVMADDADLATMLRMVAAGAHGFLLGRSDPVRLPLAVAGVLDGEAAFPRHLVRAMADELARRDRRRRAPGVDGVRLTPREDEVLRALADGVPPAVVARELQISGATVRRHVANATRKLGAPDRAAAIRLVGGDGSPGA